MIAPILLALQLAATAQPVVVRAVGKPTSIAVVGSADKPAIRADALAAALGGTTRRTDGGVLRLELPGVVITITAGVPFALIDTTIVPLTGEPWEDRAVVFVPLQLLTEIVPRFVTGFFYEPAARELREFKQVTTARRPPPPQPVRPELLPPVVGSDNPSDGPRPSRRRTGAPRTVVVDAGHGGPDGGMTGPLGGSFRIYEKNITLAVARRVAEELRQAGLTVVMTRTTDTLIALSDRGRIANRARGDLFLSIHVNAANMGWTSPGSARGFETYFLAEAKTEEARRVEQMENQSVRFETGAYAPKGDPLSFIINDMAQNEHLRESNDLAESVQSELSRIHPGPSRGVKQASFSVLRGSFMPAVLVEIGFGSNPDEASFMSSADGQRQIAAAIVSGALAYLDHYEQRVSGATGDAR